jgi:hypothetical protein
MAFQKDVRAVGHTIANGLREVAISSTRRGLFAAAYELLAQASLFNPTILALVFAAFTGNRP